MTHLVMTTLDGTDKDARAIAAGAAIAAIADSELQFVRVIDESAAEFTPRPVGAVTRRAQAELDSLLAANRSLIAGRRVATAVLDAGNVTAALLQHAVDHGALVVVMATRAVGASKRAFVGSVADEVMRQCPVPVVLVPPGAAFLGGKAYSIRRVLVPLDESSLSFRALEFLVDLPHASELEYVLLEVIAGEARRTAAATHLRMSAAWLESRGVSVVDEVIAESPRAADGIIATVRDALPEIIVMSTRGAGGLSRLVLGSVAEGVVRASELPIMLLTPRMLVGPSSKPADAP